MNLIDGKALASQIRDDVRTQIQTRGKQPTLAVLLVGNDKASHMYVGLKEKAAKEVGIETHIVKQAEMTDDEMMAQIESWNTDPAIDAILVQIPLPAGHDEQRILESIAPEKDVDGFHPQNRRKLLAGEGTAFPPLHEGILRLIASTPIALNGTKTVIIGNSSEFLEPLAYLLTKAGSFVETMNPDDLTIRNIKEAGIVIVAVGRPDFLTAKMVQDGAVLIDVGTNRRADGTVCGDIDVESMKTKNGWMTPVPGGVGPMTVAMLLSNVVRLQKN